MSSKIDTAETPSLELFVNESLNALKPFAQSDPRTMIGIGARLAGTPATPPSMRVRSELEMIHGQVGATPTWVTLSQRLSIECCSVLGNGHVEAYSVTEARC